MATYEIKNYIKLLCIRVDHFQTILEDEVNTRDTDEVEKFIERYDNRKGLKIIIIEMNSEEMFTFDELKRVIHNAHVFDYIRSIAANGNKLLPAEQLKSIGVNLLMKYLLKELTEK